MRRFSVVFASSIVVVGLGGHGFAQAPAPAAGPYKVLKTVKVGGAGGGA